MISDVSIVEKVKNQKKKKDCFDMNIFGFSSCFLGPGMGRDAVGVLTEVIVIIGVYYCLHNRVFFA